MLLKHKVDKNNTLPADALNRVAKNKQKYREKI